MVSVRGSNHIQSFTSILEIGISAQMDRWTMATVADSPPYLSAGFAK
jgi:hypothetical protein